MRGEPRVSSGSESRRGTLSQATKDEMAAVPSDVWFGRWTIALLVTAGIDFLLALGAQFQVVAFTGLVEAMLVVFDPGDVGRGRRLGYTGIRFWARIRRGEHLTRAERRRRVWAYALAVAMAAFVMVAEEFGAQNKLWLWAYIPAAVLLALAPRLRPRKRVRTRKNRATEPHTGRPQH